MMKKKSKTFIWFIVATIMLILTIRGALAMDWHEQRAIVKDMQYKHGYLGLVRYAYYEDSKEHDAYIVCKNGKPRDCIITFYKSSLNYEPNQFRCLVLHEFGHFNEYKKGSREVHLNETYADVYMWRYKKKCPRMGSY